MTIISRKPLTPDQEIVIFSKSKYKRGDVNTVLDESGRILGHAVCRGNFGSDPKLRIQTQTEKGTHTGRCTTNLLSGDKMDAQEIKQAFEANAANYTGEDIHHGVVIGVLNKACRDDDNRHAVLKFLTGKTSSKLFTEQEWVSLYMFVKPIKPEGGKWQSEHGDEELNRQCWIILEACMKQEGQLMMDM